MAKILIVDDESDARFLLRYDFEKAGHEVIEASNGADALKVLQSCHPHVIITDMMMPVMSGMELVRHMRGDPDLADIPIACVSGNDELSAGVDLAFNKFKNLSGLVAAVAELIEKGRDPQ